MKTWCLSLVLLAVLAGYSSPTRAQAIFAATETAHIQAGVGAMSLNTGYASDTNNGVAVWGDYDVRAFIGLEAEGRLGGLVAPGGIGENSYLVGPRLLYRRRRITGYGKLMAGRGSISNRVLNQSSSFNVYAFGGGLEYKVSRRFNLRAVDVELQRWPDFRPNTLSPMSLSAGVSYVLR